MDPLETIKYPLGRFDRPESFDEQQIKDWLIDLESLPLLLELTIENLDAGQLMMPYRDGGWTVQQIVHHIADSHANAYVRLKLALTEDRPVIKPYDENAWSALPDVQWTPINYSTTLLHALHRRWTDTLKFMKPSDWTRTYYHPEQQKEVPVWEMTALYAWHGRHHAAQIRSFRDRNHW